MQQILLSSEVDFSMKNVVSRIFANISRWAFIGLAQNRCNHLSPAAWHTWNHQTTTGLQLNFQEKTNESTERDQIIIMIYDPTEAGAEAYIHECVENKLPQLNIEYVQATMELHISVLEQSNTSVIKRQKYQIE